MPFEEKSSMLVAENVAKNMERSGDVTRDKDATTQSVETKLQVPDTPLEMKLGSAAAENRGEVWVEAGAEQKESVLERLFETIRSWMPGHRPKQPVPSSVSGGVSTADADEIAQTADAEERVKKLVNLALVKGVPYAVQVARHIDAYTLDRTHDELADTLFDELKRRGMVSDTDK